MNNITSAHFNTINENSGTYVSANAVSATSLKIFNESSLEVDVCHLNLGQLNKWIGFVICQKKHAHNCDDDEEMFVLLHKLPEVRATYTSKIKFLFHTECS